VTDIFREVEEDIRRDRMMALWRRWGPWVIALCIALVLATGGRVLWRNWQEQKRVEQSERFLGAVDLAQGGNHADAAASFGGMADEVGGGYGYLARLRQAAELVQAGRRDDAVEAYDRLAGEGAAPPALRDLATLLAALQLADTAPPEEVSRRVDALAVDGNVWNPLARELQILMALRRGADDEARKRLADLIVAAGTPEGLRGRARELQAALGGPAGSGP